MIAFNSAPHRWAAILAVCGLILALAGLPAAPSVTAARLAALSPDDEAALLTHLPILAEGSNPTSGEICTQILGKSQYTTQDWTAFFNKYFQTYPFTYKLYEYLTWPSFWAAPPEAQIKLQTAMNTVMQAKILEITNAGGDHLGSTLAADPLLRETLAVAHRWEMTILIHGRFTQQQRQQIFDFYIDYVEDDPQYWAKSSTINLTAQPYVAGLAAQVHAILRELAGNVAGNRFIIQDALNLQGRYLDLWDDFLLLLYDNNGFDAAQRDFIYNYYNALPRSLRLTRGISQMEFIGNSGPTWLPIWLLGVNVFSTRIGGYTENPFPPDIPPRPCDGFLEVVAHEVNHPIYAIYIEKDPRRMPEFLRILEQAGTDHMHYLRSMFEDGFFYNNRQELFASIANQYFCSSEDTFKLGLERFEQGIPQPLDQALYFADIYSTGTNQTYLYSTDLQAKITRKIVDIYRDAQGRITGINLPSGPLYVRRDAIGVIVEVGSSPPQVAAPSPISITLEQGETGTALLTLRNTGGLGLSARLKPVTGEESGVLALQGRSGVRVENNSSLNFTDRITIEAWVNPHTWQDGWFNNGRILQKGSGDNQYRLTVENGGLLFHLYNGDDEEGRLTLPNWTPPIDTWTHLAAVYDGQTMKIYVDGSERSSREFSGSFHSSTDPLFIGNKNTDLKDSFIGQMDEVAVWSEARSADQIGRDMQGSLTGGEAGLAALWRFDPQGTRVVDHSPNLNHGKLVGPASQVNAISPVTWLSLETDHPVIPPGEQYSLTVYIRSAGLEKGIHHADLRVESNDPTHPVLLVPVTLTVLEPALYLPQLAR